jgi:membrane-bound lytic murein transglycosylase B
MSTTLRILQLFLATAVTVGCASHQPNVAATATPTTRPAAPLAMTETTRAPETVRKGRPSHSGQLNHSGYLAREDVQAFALNVSQTRNIPLPAVTELLAQANRLPSAIRLMTPPEPGQARAIRDWARYRNNFVEPIRIRKGQAFLQAHRQTLALAEQRYGVPADIIVAIIGVETLYGEHMGNFRVLDAITTLSFDYPDPGRQDRIEMFQGQLTDLIELHYQGRIDATRQLGSYAGAMGIPQFMPTSVKAFSASATGAPTVDLENNVDDAIFSVGRFLQLHGWIGGLPVFAPVNLPPDPQALVDGGLTPTLDWPALAVKGASLLPGASPGPWMDYPLGVIDLPLPAQNTVQYRTATPNFFALTQYNRSYFYATAVADLAKAIGP